MSIGSLGTTLKLLRLKHKATITATANGLHVTRSLINKIEGGSRKMSLELFINYAEYFGYSGSELLAILEGKESI